MLWWLDGHSRLYDAVRVLNWKFVIWLLADVACVMLISEHCAMVIALIGIMGLPKL